jgi:hypothetical protein
MRTRSRDELQLLRVRAFGCHEQECLVGRDADASRIGIACSGWKERRHWYVLVRSDEGAPVVVAGPEISRAKLFE